MLAKTLAKIRACIRSGKYEATTHANDEMAEDGLDIIDVESSIVLGSIVRILKNDPLGVKYIVHGPAKHAGTIVCTVGRFTASGRYRIITIYAVQFEN
ncbi:MAG: DUF4258 domain-containing protein [bacterium]